MLVVVKILSAVLRFESVSSQYQFLCVEILVQPFLYVFIKFFKNNFSAFQTDNPAQASLAYLFSLNIWGYSEPDRKVFY